MKHKNQWEEGNGGAGEHGGVLGRRSYPQDVIYERRIQKMFLVNKSDIHIGKRNALMNTADLDIRMYNYPT